MARILSTILLVTSLLSASTIFAQGSRERLSLPDVPVVDANGDKEGFVSRLSVRGTVILAFTFTECTTLCPLTNAILADVDARIGQTGAAVFIVTLSLDPVDDSPEKLAKAAAEIGASGRWLWLTAAPMDTILLLDSLRFPAGPIEDHDTIFLIGDMATGEFIRVVGLPEPESLLDIALAF
ncbi:MAG: SCO family protein [Paracoccaceae bacterium]